MNRCTHELRVSYSKNEKVDENSQCHIHLWFENFQFEFSCPFVGQFFATYIYMRKNDECKSLSQGFRS